MYCTNCGQQNPDANKFCNHCGQTLPAVSGQPLPPPPAPPVYVPADPSARTDGKAIASLVLGLLSMTLFWIFTGIPAIILGHMSRSQIRRSMGRLKGEGMALAGLILGYISVAMLPFVLIIAAIAIPNLLRARMVANEASAVSSLRTIDAANVTYASGHETKGFASSLHELESAQLLSREIANGQKQGYRFTYTTTDTDQDGKIDGYFVSANPISPHGSGRQTFCTDESSVIRHESTGVECTVDSPPIG